MSPGNGEVVIAPPLTTLLTYTVSSEVQPANALFPQNTRFAVPPGANVTVLKLLQFSKAPYSVDIMGFIVPVYISLTVFGIVILVRPVPLKAPALILVIFAGIFIFVSAVQLRKVPLSIVV
jgi:hypothetical protein